MKRLFPVMMVMLAVVGATAQQPNSAPLKKARVLKNNVNLRAQSMPTAETVGQLSTNDTVLLKSMSKDWAEIVPPDTIEFWILSDYVKDGVISCPQKVNVRAGAGITFSIVGKLVTGDRVTVRGSHADWAKIAPTPSCSLWVSRSMVELIPDKPPVALPKPEPVKVEVVKKDPPKETPKDLQKPPDAVAHDPGKSTPVKTTESPKVSPVISVESVKTDKVVTSSVASSNMPVVTPTVAATELTPAAQSAAMVETLNSENTALPATSDLNLMPAIVQGQVKQYEGTLRPRGFFFRTPSRYRLVMLDREGNIKTICFVRGNNAQLESLLGRQMVVSGKEFWVHGQHYPVLIPDRIVLK